MNSQAWRKIEELTRRLAKRYGSVWVVCGPIFDDSGSKIGSVAVPSALFKALVVNTADGYKSIGFLVDNNPQSFSPRHYAVSVDSVEAAIGRNLFPSLPEEAENDFDWKVWNH